MDIYEAIDNAMRTDYAIEASGEEVNEYDAGAFYLEGYESRNEEIKKLEAQNRQMREALEEVSDILYVDQDGIGDINEARYVVESVLKEVEDEHN